MAMSIQTAIFWSVKTYSLVDDYYHSSEIYTTVFKIEDEDSMLISNAGNLLPAFRGIRLQEIVGTLNTRDADKSLARQGRKKLQRPNSGFIQHTPHEAQYTS